jgi:GNAT superfamily N-acetyltransferase
MNGDLSVVVVTKAELCEGAYLSGLADPDGVAAVSAADRSALLSNPLSRSPDDPAWLLATLGRRVIGRTRVIPGQILVHGEEVPVLWGSDLYVSPAYRSTGAGLLLLLRWASLNHTVGACGTSPRMNDIYDRLRWVAFQMPRWVMPLRSGPILERYLRWRALARICAGVADVGLKLHCKLRRAWHPELTDGLRCAEADHFPEDLAEALRNRDAPIACHRSPRWLNWLLENSLGDGMLNYRRLFLIHDTAGRVAAYFLVKVRKHAVLSRRRFRNVKLGSLADWFVFDSGAVSIEQLVWLAIERLTECGVDAIEVCTTDTQGGAFAKDLGLRRAGCLSFVIHATEPSALSHIPYEDRTQWWLTPAEGDNCFL